ncbi:hypothetical protein COV42_00510 [Candidatus Campbellbacteria bacterium CG11_big_fil_rev_8_21_14_0_20_44_21]|uniref:Vitamin K epoxide reductase domain-containing protein n=1 Tax=Candidatus Campbellbacteria bacterium CG22_combo_CG10-13_8_21_14_all_43_18 TaxID=1974530 RepID=A0A2H0DWX2_9BACT|nr:MAG: hypothetical protein COW82_00860 [Candidatus Campbellbacteria bacterium CG22_combo_CG10-13_8_21_14_all_43_18]PIR24485.1 MAG: hypothetical protein COV42_00510 [Candidatus Campbellbacteria bacterium CG11_big_fil_rev_8_21_14_0_20_44_21]
MKTDIKTLPINLLLLFSLIGFLDALYLTISHFQGNEAGCFLVHGCDIVLNSKYSEIFGLPTAFLGLLFYLVIFLGVFVYNFKKDENLIKKILLITPLGFLATLWFLYLQAVVLRAFCSYCLLSAVASTLIFLTGMSILWQQKKKERFAEKGEKMLES